MSRVKQHVVNLTAKEAKALRHFVGQGTQKARALNRARILLLAHAGKTDREIIEVLGVCRSTIASLRKRASQGAYEDILDLLREAPRSGQPLRVDSRVEANMTLIACSDPPAGAARWTLRMIADRLVELAVIESISHETVRTTLKKTASSRG